MKRGTYLLIDQALKSDLPRTDVSGENTKPGSNIVKNLQPILNKYNLSHEEELLIGSLLRCGFSTDVALQIFLYGVPEAEILKQPDLEAALMES